MRHYPLVTFFLFGIVAALGSLVLEAFLLAGQELQSPLVYTKPFPPLGLSWLLIFAAIEEVLKYALLRQAARNANLLQSLRPALVFGCGFALVEVLLLLETSALETFQDIFALVGLALLHLSTVVILAFSLRKNGRAFLGVMAAIFVHFAYNVMVSQLEQPIIPTFLFAFILFCSTLLLWEKK